MSELDTRTAEVVRDLTLQAADPLLVNEDAETGIAVYTVPAGADLKVVDLTERLARHQDRPARKTAARKVHTPEAFAAYINRHAVGGETEVWADLLTSKVTGIINSNGDEGGWGDHQVTYGVAFTVGWKAWMANDGKPLTQTAFAEHIEDRAIDVAEPTAADMLEIAQNFKATTGVKFKSSKHLSTGQTQIEYREDVDATAGKTGQMTIPEVFYLGLQPFEGARTYRVKVRFRFRITNGELYMSYRLERPEDILREAFADVVDLIDDAIDQEPHEVAIYRGSPT